MYLGFEIQQFESLNGYVGNRIDLYEAQAKGRVGNLAQYIIGTYAGRQILDAEALSNQIFPEAKYDVFVSHSHADQRKAIDLAIALESRGLKVFVDSTVWGFYPELVNTIASAVHPSTGETADRLKLRISADVHMMLTSALHRTIAKAETFIFVRTEKSVPLTYSATERTLSPWLFSELQFSFQVRHAAPQRILKRLQGTLLDSVKGFNTMSLESMQYLMAFEAFNDHLPTVYGHGLREWFAQLPSNARGAEVLDSLYTQFSLESDYYRRRRELHAL